MLSHLLVSIVLVGLSSTQDGPPVFRAGAYVIAIEIPFFEGRRWCRGTKPITTLTAKDLRVSLDKKPYPDAELVPDDKRPGYYLLSFPVPESSRDGKRHKIDVKFVKGGGLSWDTDIPKPSATSKPGQFEDWISEACK